MPSTNWASRRVVHIMVLTSGWLLAGTCTLLHAQTIKADVAALDVPDGKASVFGAKTGAPVRLIKRQGFWVQIESGGKTGWVKASALNFAALSAGPVAIDTGRTGQGNIVATSAARGLSAKDILSGAPRHDEVLKLAGFAADASAVRAFAAQGSIHPATRPVALREPPSSPSASASVTPPGGVAGVVAASSTQSDSKKAADAW